MIFDHRVKHGGKWYLPGQDVPVDEPPKGPIVVEVKEEAPKKTTTKKATTTRKKKQ